MLHTDKPVNEKDIFKYMKCKSQNDSFIRATDACRKHI